jgi:DNA-binding NarL/FixJ family response regulator
LHDVTPMLRSELDDFASRHELTPREYDVLFLLVSGLNTVSRISKRLGLSQNTVHNHFKNVFRRTGTNSKAGLLALFINEAMTRRAGAQPYLRPPRVLLVDREGRERSALSSALVEHGMSVFEEPDSRLVNARISERKIDVVLAELDLPGESGRGVLEDVRTRYGQHPAVLLLTADPTCSHREWLDRGAGGVFLKPIGLDRLLFAILEQCTDTPYERSRLQRVDTTLEAQLDAQLAGAIANLSFGGAFVEVSDEHWRRDAYDVGQTVRLHFSLEPGAAPLELQAEVRWIRKSSRPSLPAGLGLRFTELSDSQRTTLETFVRKKKLLSLAPAALQLGPRGPSPARA